MTSDRAPLSLSAKIRRRVLISGEVQGVWFRDSCQVLARRLGVSGTVRNLADGRVEAVIEGLPDEVNELANWCQHGPPRARVTEIQVTDEPAEGLFGFRITG